MLKVVRSLEGARAELSEKHGFSHPLKSQKRSNRDSKSDLEAALSEVERVLGSHLDWLTDALAEALSERAQAVTNLRQEL